jgi:MFS family permease
MIEASKKRNLVLLFATRSLRMFAYGLVSVVLLLYLTGLGFGTGSIGLLFSFALLGDTLLSFLITIRADRIGRRRMLVAGALLMLAAGFPLAASTNYALILVALTIGVISPTGNEAGPFLALEQAALSELVPSETRTSVFAWYNLAGSLSTALGALCSGWISQALQGSGANPVASYRVSVLAYCGIGLVLALLFLLTTREIEAPRPVATVGKLGLGGSRGIVAKLAALFSLDAFGGGFVVQSAMAYWFHIRFGAGPGLIGSVFFGANVLAGISALLAARISKRIGLVNTMVFTHLPSNLLLILVPLMPSLPLAMAVLLARFAISQMDVPTRQSYTMAVVRPEERSAAAGITGIARTTGAAVSPSIAGPLLANPATAGAVFIIAGGIKVCYDLLLYRAFRKMDNKGESR